MKVRSRVRITGEVLVQVRDQFGRVKSEQRVGNLVVDAGLSLLANRIASASPSSGCLINYVGVGTGTDAPASNDTSLQTETARHQVTSRANSATISSVSVTFDAGVVPTSTLKEVGLFIDATGVADSGILFSRTAIDLVVTALDSVFVDWRITFSNV